VLKTLTISFVALNVLWLLTGCSETPTPMVPDTFVASYDKTPIYYDSTGEGDIAIVFVHCWTCNHTFWDNQVLEYAKHYRVVRVDLAGHGASGKGRQDYTIAGFGQDVAAVADALKLKKIVLIGHSMGGPVSVEAEKILKDRVLAVVGVDTFYTPFPVPKTDEEATAFVKPFKDDFAGANKAFLETMFMPSADPRAKQKIIDTVLAADPKIALQALKDIIRWYRFEAESSLARLGNRLWNINTDPAGKNQPLNERVRLIAGVGHFIPQVAPKTFNDELRAILKMAISDNESAAG
jgi:pimeloyl-ACP methyl ester carboxylesterase